MHILQLVSYTTVNPTRSKRRHPSLSTNISPHTSHNLLTGKNVKWDNYEYDFCKLALRYLGKFVCIRLSGSLIRSMASY